MNRSSFEKIRDGNVLMSIPQAKMAERAMAVIEAAHPLPARVADIIIETGLDPDRVERLCVSLARQGKITIERYKNRTPSYRLVTP